MAGLFSRKKKFDGIVEAVHYNPNGDIDWIRIYERRGPTYSDRLLLDRDTLIQRLKAGKIIVAGERLPFQASTFQTQDRLKLASNNGREIILTENSTASHDHVEGVPVI